MSVLKINESNIESIKSEGKPLLLDFYAEWCGPCRMVGPVIEEIAGERDDILVGKVNVDEAAELASLFKVYSIPTLVLIKDGKEIRRALGARPKAGIMALIDG